MGIPVSVKAARADAPITVPGTFRVISTTALSSGRTRCAACTKSTDSPIAHASCADGPEGSEYTGWGHAGNLPGYWSAVVYYPERDVIIVTMINRDMVNGVMLDHTIFNPTLSAVLDALEPTAP